MTSSSGNEIPWGSVCCHGWMASTGDNISRFLAKKTPSQWKGRKYQMSSFPGFNKSEVSLVSARACKGSRVYNENRRKNVPNAVLVVSNCLERRFFPLLFGWKLSWRWETGHMQVMRECLFLALGGQKVSCSVDWAELMHLSHTVQGWRLGNGAGSETQSDPVCFG